MRLGFGPPDVNRSFFAKGLTIQVQCRAELILMFSVLALAAFGRFVVERAWEKRHEPLPVRARVDEVEVPGFIDNE